MLYTGFGAHELLALLAQVLTIYGILIKQAWIQKALLRGEVWVGNGVQDAEGKMSKASRGD